MPNEPKKQAKTSKKMLSARRKRLIDELSNPQNKSVAEAGRKAGFAQSSIRSTVYGLVADPHISEEVERRRRRAILHSKTSPEEVLGSAVFSMRTSIDDLLDENGSFSIKKARETGAIDMVKEIEIKTTINKDTGEKEIIHKVKLESSSAARREVGNYIGLEKFAPVQKTPEELAISLFEFLIERFGDAPREKIIQKVQQEFPAVDIKLLESGEISIKTLELKRNG